MASHGNQSTNAAAPYVFGHLAPNAITASTFTTLTFAILCVVARLFTRFFVTRQPWWDDLCIAIGFLCATAQSILTEIMIHGGLGRHFRDIHTDDWTPFFKASYLSLGFFSLSAGLVKTALLLQFLRIFNPKSSAYKATLGLLALAVIWMTGFGFISWFPCFPVAKAWHPERPGHCYGLGATSYNIRQFLATILAHSTSNFVIDLAVLALGAVMILQLGADRPNLRLRLFALLTIGLLVNASAFCRMVFIVKQLIQADAEPVEQDPTWSMAAGVTLLNIEVNLSAVCASVPVFWAPMQQAVRDQWSKIFVTQEVSVVWTRRQGSSCDSDDEQRLTRLTSSRSGQKFAETNVALSDISVRSHRQPSHYDDEFVQSYVDPLRSEAAGVSATTVRSDITERRYRETQQEI